MKILKINKTKWRIWTYSKQSHIFTMNGRLKNKFNVVMTNCCSVWWRDAHCSRSAGGSRASGKNHPLKKFDTLVQVNTVEAVNTAATLSAALSSINSVLAPRRLFIPTASAHLFGRCTVDQGSSCLRVFSQGLLLRRISAAVYLLIASFSLLTTTS